VEPQCRHDAPAAAPGEHHGFGAGVLIDVHLVETRLGVLQHPLHPAAVRAPGRAVDDEVLGVDADAIGEPLGLRAGEADADDADLAVRLAEQHGGKVHLRADPEPLQGRRGLRLDGEVDAVAAAGGRLGVAGRVEKDLALQHVAHRTGPGTRTAVPLTAAEAGAVRKWMTAATASVVTQVAGSASGIALRLAAVSMVPGSTALARPPKGASSRASDSTRRSMPALAAA